MSQRVSVIVPVYNIEEYVEECIVSLINQTYSNIEIILVNDGSTDKSGEICKAYQELDNRIRVICQPNGGLASAINTGLAHACGEYILFVDGDDWICPDTVEYSINLLNKEFADIVVYDFSYVPQFEQECECIEITDNIGALKNLYNYDSELRNIRLMTSIRWTKLYRKSVLQDIIFPVGRIHEDEIVHEIIYKADKVVYSNRKCYYYRQREGSIIHEALSIKVLDKLQSFKERVLFFEKISNDELLQLAVNKYVYLYIQMFCKTGLIKNQGERKEFETRIIEYGIWAVKYKKYWNKKAKVEMWLSIKAPTLLRGLFYLTHRKEMKN